MTEPTTPPPPLRSAHTTTFLPLLQELGLSLMVTTYQAGKLVLIRAEDDHLNTHFRGMDRPMGLALKGGQLAVGTAMHINEFRNVPYVAARLSPAGKHDACFLPSRNYVTGDIDIHEMAWAEQPDGPASAPRLWFVNTRFSCLCTLDAHHSFLPCWHPPFVTALAPEDRCHLNGLCLVNQQPRYVTALGATDTAQGWRPNKARGGVLLDVPSGATIVGGLSMPHSPRWHNGQLWLLESGSGSLGTVDAASGRFHKVVEMPGFTRGLDFYDHLAFVGLSQVRESASFKDIPITQRLTERICGVWVIDLDRGQVIAFLKFEDAVQEIFAVQVVAGFRYPDLIKDDPAIIGGTYVIP